jgi:hypothetical protein
MRKDVMNNNETIWQQPTSLSMPPTCKLSFRIKIPPTITPIAAAKITEAKMLSIFDDEKKMFFIKKFRHKNIFNDKKC